jgi:hypothetical protein
MLARNPLDPAAGPALFHPFKWRPSFSRTLAHWTLTRLATCNPFIHFISRTGGLLPPTNALQQGLASGPAAQRLSGFTVQGLQMCSPRSAHRGGQETGAARRLNCRGSSPPSRAQNESKPRVPRPGSTCTINLLSFV